MDWAEKVESLGGGHSDAMKQAAVDRLEHGATRFGTRVALRPDLDDDRSALSESIQRTVRAYWPDDQRCQCWMSKKVGRCSHTLAAEAYTAAGPWPLVDVGEDEVESVPAKARSRVSKHEEAARSVASAAAWAAKTFSGKVATVYTYVPFPQFR